ncbi:MAG: restriction endonuclease subunit S [Desulfobulbaceae bacterium]
MKWPTLTLEEVASVQRGKFSARPRNDPKYYGGNIPFIQTGDVANSAGCVRSYSQTLNADGLSVSKLFPKGSLAITIAANIGDVAQVNFEFACPDSLVVVQAKDGICIDWLRYSLQSKKSSLKSLAPQNAQKNINLEVLRPLPLDVPSIQEQKNIAKVLLTWDSAIDLTERLIAEKQLRRKGLLHQLLTGKRRLPGHVGDWREHEIDKLFREVNRPVKWDDDELYDLISVRRRSGGLFHRESLYGRQILTKNLKTAHAGDFLISKMQVLHGATGLVTPEFDGMKISGSYISLVPRKPGIVSMEFFSYFSQLPSFYHLTFLASFGVHIEKMTFNVKWFMQSKISIPPSMAEQDAIVKFLKSADRELELLQAKANALREQKKGLMQQLLTGKKRVKV